MAITFPSNPTTNQTYTYGGKVWTFNGSRWLNTGASYTSSTPVVPITVSDTEPGSTQEGSIWVDSSTGTLSVYVGGAWVLASAGVLNVAANTLPGNSIVDGSITATQLASGAAVPTQTGQSGKFLTTNGTSASWAIVDALPSQATNSGKYLTTDGTTASWGTVSSMTRAQAMTMGIIFGG